MAAMAGCGLPGFLNFVGEVSVFFGAWQEPALRVVTVLAVWGALIIGAVYMLRAVRAALHGPAREDATYVTDVTDANLWRKLPYAVLIVSLLVFGFFPKLLTEKIKPVTENIVNMATLITSATPTTAATKTNAPPMTICRMSSARFQRKCFSGNRCRKLATA